MADIYLIVDSGEPNTRVVQAGQTPTQVAAYQLPVPDGQDPEQAAQDYLVHNNFPVNSVVYLVDASLVQAYTLAPVLQPVTAGTATP